MTLAEIIQIKQDRQNGVIVCNATINKLIDYAHDLYWKNQHLAAEAIGMDILKAELAEAKAKLQNGEEP